MFVINNITSDAKQIQSVILFNGKNLSLYMEYKPQQLGWFMSLSYLGTFILNNIRITTSPNMLHQFKNLIPFGLACFVEGNQEPLLQDDFITQRAQLFILDTSEIQEFEDILRGEIST